MARSSSFGVYLGDQGAVVGKRNLGGGLAGRGDEGCALWLWHLEKMVHPDGCFPHCVGKVRDFPSFFEEVLRHHHLIITTDTVVNAWARR